MHILNNNALANLWRKQFSTYFLFLLISELRDRYLWSNLQMWLCSQNIIYYLNPVMRTMCSGLVSFIAQPTPQHRSVIWCYMVEMEMSVHQYSTDVVIFWRTYLTPTWYVFRVRLFISCVQMRLEASLVRLESISVRAESLLVEEWDTLSVWAHEFLLVTDL